MGGGAPSSTARRGWPSSLRRSARRPRANAGCAATLSRRGSPAGAAPVMKSGTAAVGIGNLDNSVADVARSHVEARQALRLTRRAGGKGRLASYRSMGAFRLLLQLQSPDALRRFVEELLGTLIKYAQSRDTPLLETLEALSSARWVRRAAARQLG